MIAIDQLTDEQFERQALDLLKREFGLDGLARFLRLNRAGTGDYTCDRDDWQKDLSSIRSFSPSRNTAKSLRHSFLLQRERRHPELFQICPLAVDLQNSNHLSPMSLGQSVT